MTALLCLAGAAVGAAFVLGLALGVKRGRLLEQNAALAKRNARMRDLLADLGIQKRRDDSTLTAMLALLGPREIDE